MINLTPKQGKVVTVEAGHVLVDAGAGSGKTTTVVQMLCHQIGIEVMVDGKALEPVSTPLTLGQIAAITYTNQSAADLKRKLRAALRAGGGRDLAADVDVARIGTIHGFCADLLRDFALRAGVRPGRAVRDAGEAQVLLRECAHNALLQAIEAMDVDGLEQLLSGRKFKQITAWVTEAALDSDRLLAWETGRSAMRPHEGALLTIATRAAHLHRDRLVRDGALDFDQMLVASRDLLRDSAVRSAVQQRMRLLVVDEFQDVDPVQKDIAFLLGGIDCEDRHPTRLILIGDPKQSIFRFRRADVALWNEVKDRFGAGDGVVLPLPENFRSKAAILGMVDCVVGAVMAAPVSDDGVRRPFEVEYVPIEARAKHADGDHAVEFIVIPADADGKALNSARVREAEATAVAQRIRELCEEGTPYGDMAMLLVGWGAVDDYERALSQAGIPVYVLRSEGFWQTREVLDCVLALRAIRSPLDDVAVVGFLKSPFVGVRDDTLLALARESSGNGIASALSKVACERQLLERASRLLMEFGVLRDRVSAHDLLQRLLDSSGYLAAVALTEAGQQGVANIRKLLRIAAAAPDQSLGELLRTWAEEREREDRVAPERLYRERSNVVTITSVHSAKGLEWPVVFWCDLVREVPSEKGKLLAGSKLFRLQDESLLDHKGKPCDPEFAELREALRLEQKAESYRLWYVASTRAQQRLILSGIPLGELHRSALSPARMLREKFSTLDSGQVVEYAAHDGTVYHAKVLPLVAAAAAVQVPRVEPQLPLPPAPMESPRVSARLSASQLMAFSYDPGTWWAQHVRQFDGDPTGQHHRSRAKAIATGLVIHEVLKGLGLDAVVEEALLERAIIKWDKDAPAPTSIDGAAYRAQVRAGVSGASGSPAWVGVASLPSARRELSFTRVLPDGTALNGSFDLVARSGDRAQIVDVKSTAAGEMVSTERYAVQGAIYADAVRAITGLDEVSFTVLAVPSGAVTSVPLTAKVEQLVAQIRGTESAHLP